MLFPITVVALFGLVPSSSIQMPSAMASEVSQASMIKCPVTGKTIPTETGVRVSVRNHEYLVYDQAAADELKSNPDKYLDENGMPKNAKKENANLQSKIF